MYRKFHKLRVRFAELDMSQAEAARRAGIPPSTLTARMTGRLPFTARDIAGLCKVLNIPADQIGFFEELPASKKVG
jgi:transcriptional regulator with XRE-family HTH domain